ncbi:hypothetical protein [Marinobacter sp. F4206]|uniref:hypothetical protein n=1 Tax=Marinobacter sp. F4206 TaxID=2861777 RepID=UPI001C5EBCEB|nr:hypothetical protein [Marinobacter sp. F4206]MBW4934980.1 hypothetical protein [Marinobacter sp. F4206]
MSEIENQKDKYHWWRWLFVPVVPPVAGLAGGAAFHLMQWFGMKMTGGYSEDGWIFLYFMPLVTAGFVGWAYSWSAAMIAPSARLKASFTMTVFLFLFAVFASVVAIVGPEYSRFEVVSVVLMSIAAVMGSIVALIGIKKAHSNEP